MKKINIFLFICLISVMFISSNIPSDMNMVNATNIKYSECITLNYSFEMPTIKTIMNNDEEFTSIQLHHLPLYKKDDTSPLPTKPVRIMLSPSEIIKDIIVSTSNPKIYKLDDFKTLTGISKSFSTSSDSETVINDADSISIDQKLTLLNNQGFISKEKPYELFDIQYFRGYPILHLNLYPLQYSNDTSTLHYYNHMNVTINTKQVSTHPLYRNLINDEIEVKNKVDNPDLFKASTLDSSLYDYVIITNEELSNTNETYTFSDLMNHHENNGLSCTIKTVEEIKNEYNGIDTQEKIRKFIKDAYQNWGVTWVLLGGDDNIVPIRFLHDIDGNDNQLSSDLYYQCLDGNYNYDDDSLWGEKNDGENGDTIDLYAEVYIGRAPVDDGHDVSNFVEKTLSYEESDWNEDEYLQKVLGVGERTWNGAGGWGAGYVERCMDYCHDYDHETYGIPTEIYDDTLLFERDMAWLESDLLWNINNGVNIINHVGHGSSNGAMKLSTNDIYDKTKLHNTNKYPFVYSQACFAGQFEEHDCVAETWLNVEKAGAFAVIMNSGEGIGSTIDYDGTSNRYTREFFDALYSNQEIITRIGQANQDSKEDNIWRINEPGKMMYHVYYNLNLFGDPFISIKGAKGTSADFSWTPEYPKTGGVISFSDMSTGGIIHWSWEFGDGAYSYDQNPIHAYTSEGIYTVKLTIIDIYGSSMKKTKEIEVKNHWFPVANAQYTFNGENEFTIDFNSDESFDPDGTIISYEWDFDDGTTSTQKNPTHLFPGEDIFHVCLEVTDDEYNIGVVYLTVTIEKQTPPDIPNPPTGMINGVAGYNYSFMVSTTDVEGYSIRYAWDWGDGSPIEWSNYYGSGEICSMSHVWKSEGKYAVRVKAQDIPGAQSNWSDSLMVDINKNEEPTVSIDKPNNALFIDNNKILPFFTNVVFGDIDIEIHASDEIGLNRVELFIDDELKANMTIEPYIWTWNESSFLKNRHTIMVIAYDTLGSYSIEEIKVWKFL